MWIHTLVDSFDIPLRPAGSLVIGILGSLCHLSRDPRNTPAPLSIEGTRRNLGGGGTWGASGGAETLKPKALNEPETSGGRTG